MIVSLFQWPYSQGSIDSGLSTNLPSAFKLAGEFGDTNVFDTVFPDGPVSQSWNHVLTQPSVSTGSGITFTSQAEYQTYPPVDKYRTALKVVSKKIQGKKTLDTDIIGQKIVRQSDSGAYSTANPVFIRGNFTEGDNYLVACPGTSGTSIFIEAVINYTAKTVDIYYNETLAYSKQGLTGDTVEIVFGTVGETQDSAGVTIEPWASCYAYGNNNWFTRYQYLQGYRAFNCVGDTVQTPRLGNISVEYLPVNETSELGSNTQLKPLSASGSLASNLNARATLDSASKIVIDSSKGASAGTAYGYISPQDQVSSKGKRILAVGVTAYGERSVPEAGSSLDVVIRKGRGTAVGIENNHALGVGNQNILSIYDLVANGEDYISSATDGTELRQLFDVGLKTGK